MYPSCEAGGTNVFHCLGSIWKEELLWGGQRVQAQMSYPWSWKTLNRATGPEHLGWLLRYLALGWVRRARAFLFPPAQNSFSAHPHCILQITISWDSLTGQGQATLPKQAPDSLLLFFLKSVLSVWGRYLTSHLWVWVQRDPWHGLNAPPDSSPLFSLQGPNGKPERRSHRFLLSWGSPRADQPSVISSALTAERKALEQPRNARVTKESTSV